MTAVLHDRFGDYHDTLLVINNDHVWRIYRDSGTVYKAYPATYYYDIWPKHIRTFYGMWDGMFDKVFPLRAAHFIEVNAFKFNKVKQLESSIRLKCVV